MAFDKDAMYEIIKDFEGFDSNLYYDSRGLITIGVGFNIHSVINLRNEVFTTLGVAETTVNSRGETELRGKTINKGDRLLLSLIIT